MNKTNYTTNPTMEDMELSCFFDNDMARMDFETMFSVIQHDGYSTTAVHALRDDEENAPVDLSECYDLSKTTEKQFRQFCWSRYDGGSMRECIEDKQREGHTWRDFALSILDHEIGLPDAARDGFPEIGDLIWNSVSVTGYCQGDYAIVLYKMDEGTADEGKMKDHFQKLLYSSPVYCSLEVDGEIIHLSEGLSDSYDYEKDELLEYAKSEGLSPEALQWLSENLPDYPDHI